MTASALLQAEKKRQKPIGDKSVYSLVRYEFASSSRKSRQRPDLCIFHRVPALLQ